MKCVDRLNGMLAFAVYDRERQVFEACRNPFGIKPFYFLFLGNGDMLFASEIKALWVHPQAVSQVEYESLREYLSFQFCLNGKTLFKHVRCLEPGSILSWKVKEPHPPAISSYWKPEYVVDTHHTEDLISNPQPYSRALWGMLNIELWF
jgi:asparagine synthase (glutamine-hydrolysing)